MKFQRTPKVRPLKAALRLAVLKAVGVSAALVVGYVSAAVTADLGGDPQPDVATADQAAARLLAENQCSTNALDPAEVRSAFVRRAGSIHHVTLDEAMAVREGRRPGTLVAVCRAPR